MTKVEIIKANLNSKNENSVIKAKKKVCAYARVSTDSEEQKNSYSSQIKHYSSMIKSNPDYEFVGVYADEGISGTLVKKRDEFKKMIDDALNGKIDIIIAKSISRFARNTLDTLKYVRLLREHHVDIHFEKENIHTLDMDSEMFLTFYSAFAQAESESISQNVKMGIRAKMKRGEATSGYKIYGYTWNKETKNFDINEKQAEVIRKIYDLYCEGKGAQTISKILNEKGIKTINNKKWVRTGVINIIRNEKYVGDLVSQKTYVEDPITHRQVKNLGEKEKYYVKEHHEPIVTRDVWNKAQEILNKRSSLVIPNGSKHISRNTMKYAFSCKIICGFCGSVYTRRTSGPLADGSKNYYWRCYTKVENHDECLNSISIKEEHLENMFAELFNSLIKNKHKTKDQLFKAIKDMLEESDYKKDIEKLNNEKLTLQNKLSKLVDMKLEDIIDKDTYISKETEIKEQIDNIYFKLEQLDKLEKENNNISQKLKEVEQVLNIPTKMDKFDRKVFDNIVDKIVIGEVLENGEVNSNIIRFILKSGTEYKIDKKNNRNHGVSLCNNRKAHLTTPFPSSLL